MAKDKKHQKLKNIALQQEAEAKKDGGKATQILNAVERRAMSIEDADEHAQPFVALKYYNHHHQCFSEWTPDELKAFSAFNDKVRSLSWVEIFRTGGKSGSKVGLGFTQLGEEVIAGLSHPTNLRQISKDIQFFELRVTGKARAIGFRIKAIFFLVWLDRGHKACA